MIWLRLDTVLAIHRRQIAEHGGQDGVRDLGLLESALARPQNILVYSDNPVISSLAAAYAIGIARNHPFLDGNKRVALVVLRVFLLLNGHDLIASQEEKFLISLALADGKMTENELIGWIEGHLKILS